MRHAIVLLLIFSMALFSGCAWSDFGEEDQKTEDQKELAQNEQDIDTLNRLKDEAKEDLDSGEIDQEQYDEKVTVYDEDLQEKEERRVTLKELVGGFSLLSLLGLAVRAAAKHGSPLGLIFDVVNMSKNIFKTFKG